MHSQPGTQPGSDPLPPLLSELQACRDKCATALSFSLDILGWGSRVKITFCGGVLQTHCPAGHGECLCYGVNGRVLGCSMKFPWVVPCSLGSETSEDMVIVLPRVTSCEEEGLIL